MRTVRLMLGMLKTDKDAEEINFPEELVMNSSADRFIGYLRSVGKRYCIVRHNIEGNDE